MFILLPGVAKRPYLRGEGESKGTVSVPLTKPQFLMRVAPESVTMLLLVSDCTSNEGAMLFCQNYASVSCSLSPRSGEIYSLHLT